MKLTAKQHAENLCEDLGALMHRWVIWLYRKEIDSPLHEVSTKSQVSRTRVNDMYLGEAPQATVEEMGAIEWAAEQLLKDGEA